MRISTKKQRESTSAHPVLKQACVHIRREEEVSDEEQQAGSSNLPKRFHWRDSSYTSALYCGSSESEKQKGGARKEDEPMRMTSAMAGGDG